MGQVLVGRMGKVIHFPLALLVGSFLKPRLLQPPHPVVVPTRQLHERLSLRQGVVSQPLLEHRRGGLVEDGVPPVGVPEGMGVGPPGSSPAATAASFIDLLTHFRLASKSDLARSFAWTDAGSPRLSTRSSGMGTSRPFLPLFPVTSGLREMIGGLVKPEVRRPEGEALPDPQTGPEHYPHGHAHLVRRGRGHQRPGLLGGEIVGESLGFSRHATANLRGFPGPSLPAEGVQEQ